MIIVNWFKSLNRMWVSAGWVVMMLSNLSAYSQAKPQEPATLSGTVVQVTNAATYTYIQVDTGRDKVWAAAPQFSLKVGQKVSFSTGMPMKNFQSNTLKRKFDVVYFVDKVDGPGLANSPGSTGGAVGAPNDAVHAGVRHPARARASVPIDSSDIKKAPGGFTISEIHQQKTKLENKEIILRGKVVKYNPQIMNRNWVHVQDGTGSPESNDLTVTTEDTTAVGDTVLVRGVLGLNKDYGHGYKYGLIIERARLQVEEKAK